jgi:hypothetical protein
MVLKPPFERPRRRRSRSFSPSFLSTLSRLFVSSRVRVPFCTHDLSAAGTVLYF